MGNTKLPWREIAAALAGGLLVWAWRKREGQQSAGQLISFVVPPLPPASVEASQAVVPQNETGNEPPPEIMAVLAQMQERMREMFSAPPSAPEARTDISIIVHQDRGILEIHVANGFAELWVREQARKYGQLFEPATPGGPFVLFVNQTYRAMEVADWLGRGLVQWYKGDGNGCTPVDSSG